MTAPTPVCKVTVLRVGSGNHPGRCGKDVVRHGLCVKHLADRIRLGGTP